MAGPTRYSLLSYGAMVTCEPRTSAYAAALRQAITPGCTVFDLGAGPGVFSLLACQYGAGSVIAIEPDDSVQLLRQLAEDNGCGDRISTFLGVSTDFESPTKADVIISDLHGCLPFFEEHIPTIVDARHRLLAPRGKLIPARDNLRIALVESAEDQASSEEPWVRNHLGLNLGSLRRFTVNSWWKVKLGADALLSDPVDLATLDYYEVTDPDLDSEKELTVARTGTAHGFAVWFDAELAPGIGFSNAPGAPPQIYGQTFLPLEHAFDVAPGDRVAVRFTANLVDGSYVWGWSGSLFRRGRIEPEFNFRQSTFLSKVMSQQTLRPRAADFIPPAREAHEVDRFCLSLIDGDRTLEEIAASLRMEFPARFNTTTQALNHVVELTTRYR